MKGWVKTMKSLLAEAQDPIFLPGGDGMSITGVGLTSQGMAFVTQANHELLAAVAAEKARRHAFADTNFRRYK